jgi:hypothetical protein
MLSLQGFRQENNLVYVKNFPSGTFLINGETRLVRTSGDMILDEAVCSPDPEQTKFFRVTSTKSLKHYVGESGSVTIISPAEYLDLKQQIEQKHAFLDEDDYSMTWRTLEGKHEFERFQYNWKPVYEEIVSYEPVVIVVDGEVVSCPDYITPMRKICGDLTHTLYQYNARGHIVHLVVTILEKYGFRALTDKPAVFGRPKDFNNTYYIGDSIAYSQIFTKEKPDGNYITIIAPELKELEKLTTFTGTFDECKARRTSMVIKLKNALFSYLDRHKSVESLDLTIGQVVSDLNRIYHSVVGLDVMKKSQSDFSNLRNDIRKTIQSYQERVVEKNETSSEVGN